MACAVWKQIMDEMGTEAELLRGKTVAFTGRLASMTRAKAAELIRSFGGRWAPTISKRTSLLVVGQEGWPLRKDGRLSHKLLLTRKLQDYHAIEVITEADLLARLGLASQSSLLSTAQLSQVLKVSGERIRRWVELGLLRPAATVAGVHSFDFQQAAWARSLCEFAAAGITPKRLRRSLEELRRWLPHVEQPLEQLAVLEKDGQLMIRLQEGALCEPAGQGLFDFEEQAPARALPVESPEDNAEAWFERGCEHEDKGRLEDAAKAYRQALLYGGPDRDACFNLANVLYTLGDYAMAAERYRQALEIDRTFVEAWNNLGNVLADLGEYDEAEQAFKRVLKLDPSQGDVHYNLAELLDKTGKVTRASEHYRCYLRYQPVGPWSEHARRRLKRLQA
jgi:tetratricopeptide (TPR) repeat protein